MSSEVEQVLNRFYVQHGRIDSTVFVAPNVALIEELQREINGKLTFEAEIEQRDRDPFKSLRVRFIENTSAGLHAYLRCSSTGGHHIRWSHSGQPEHRGGEGNTEITAFDHVDQRFFAVETEVIDGKVRPVNLHLAIVKALTASLKEAANAFEEYRRNRRG